VDVLREGRALPDVQVARARQVDREHLADPSRPGRHDHDAIRQEHRLGDRVRDEHNGLARLLPDPLEVDLELVASQRVEGAEGFVHQEERRVVDEGPTEGDTLAHPARQLEGVPPLEALEADGGDEGPGAGLVRPRVFPPHHELEEHVAQHGAPVEQEIALEDDADVRVGRRHRPALDTYLAPGGLDQARGEREQGALAAAARPDDRDELPPGVIKKVVGSCPEGATFGCTAGKGYEGDGSPALQAKLRYDISQVTEPKGGLAFDAASIRVLPIRPEDAYGGQRIALLARLGPARLRVQVDVGAGDAVVPEPQWLEYPSLLDFPRPRLRAYRPETAIAEKLHAYTMPRTRPNSRVKDLSDIALLATAQIIDAKRLREALDQTFGFRKTHSLPAVLPPPLAAWETPYAAMAREDQLAWPTLDKVTTAAKAFLDPVLTGNLDAAWNPGTWTWGKP